jgi:diguanylate cyclase (GGDEF)-like protein/PAS domain S-box-containing protein
MKLLIVDDDDINLKLLRAQLEAEGHAVLDAANGVEALQLLDREHVDGIVSDILMPRMDGYRLCLEVRQHARHREIPLVLYTSTYNAPADRKLAELAGADGYIAKPAPAQVILDALHAAARHPRTPASAHPLENPVLKEYSETLVRKLEERSLQLEGAHRGLLQIEARLSGLVESAMDAILAIDEQQRTVLFNAAAGRIFGCPPGEALGRPLSDFIPQRFWGANTAHIAPPGREPSIEGLLGTHTAWAVRRGGREFPIEASTSRLDTSQGRLYTLFVRDITARHEAEQALARSEAGLRRAQDLAQLAHVITGADGAFESWSETFPRLIGVDASRMPRSTRQWLDIIHPDDRDLFRTAAIEAARDGVRSDLEYRVRRGDIWVDVRQVMEPLPVDPGGETGGRRWFNTLQDVADQKQTELKIRSLNRVYAVLRGITTLIVRVQDRDDLFREACRIAVEVGKFPKAWIGVVEGDGPAVRVAAGHGAPDTFFEALQVRLTANIADGHSLVARALLDMEPIVSNDVAQEPEVMERTMVLTSGSRSLAAFPLAVDRKAVGVLVLHAEAVGFFDGEEMTLLRELAGDISFALDHLSKTERIHYLSTYDALTGLPNRRLFTERLSQRIEALRDRGEMLAVVLVDLEGFRRVNEMLGREAGDELLMMAASRLQQGNPSAARIGVDVFAFTIHDRHSAADVAHALDDLASRSFGEPFMLSGEELRIGCRSGVAVFPDDGDDAETLLRNAEAALRRAKASAEHRVFYAPEMNAQAAAVLAMESRLRRAVERREFVLHYQPKVRLGDGQISGVEALIRWHDPEHGLVLPGRFIPILEDTGLIGAVGQWALVQALADYRRWRAAGFGPFRVAVNVSAVQLNRPDFAAQIGRIVADAEGATLELEITESVIVGNVDRTVAMLADIRAHDVNIAIDDFGTGYSSLSYIAKLPVTSLKIDRAFIAGMIEGPHGMAIVSSTIALAHALNLTVVAEGVETEEQARMLRALACDEAQGYLYSRPVSATDIEALLRADCSLPAGRPR